MSWNFPLGDWCCLMFYFAALGTSPWPKLSEIAWQHEISEAWIHLGCCKGWAGDLDRERGAAAILRYHKHGGFLAATETQPALHRVVNMELILTINQICTMLPFPVKTLQWFPTGMKIKSEVPTVGCGAFCILTPYLLSLDPKPFSSS